MSNVSHYLSVKILTDNMCRAVMKGTSCKLQSNRVNSALPYVLTLPLKHSILSALGSVKPLL